MHGGESDGDEADRACSFSFPCIPPAARRWSAGDILWRGVEIDCPLVEGREGDLERDPKSDRSAGG